MKYPQERGPEKRLEGFATFQTCVFLTPPSVPRHREAAHRMDMAASRARFEQGLSLSDEGQFGCNGALHTLYNVKMCLTHAI